MANLVKSTSGSRKLMTVLNRLGHCISYSMYEELETELAMAIRSRETCSPVGAKRGIVMGNAFDNYDEIVFSLSGLESLHDTMGIFYQVVDTEASEVETEVLVESQETAVLANKITGRRKRKLPLSSEELPPYHKRLRMDQFYYENTSCNDLSVCTKQYQKLDTLFLLMHINSDDVPMWLGFNACGYHDRVAKQNVYYMPNLNKPITTQEVIVETMRTSQKCAQECGQQYGLVTYDLDVARTARKIQITDQPEFDNNLFIVFGAFHIQMCFFRSMQWGKL